MPPTFLAKQQPKYLTAQALQTTFLNAYPLGNGSGLSEPEPPALETASSLLKSNPNHVT